MKSGSRVFIKALIDSGNLFGDIMSERLANLLKIKYKPCANKVQERRTFLKEQLDVKNMIINQDQQEQVIDLFMKHFDAVSVSGEDYGSSDLLQFHKTLLPGSHTV